jgi:hypothetical protein
MSDANLTPPPHAPAADPNAPVMSTPETLSNIFFEPGATFEALRARPRFLAVALILVALTALVTVLLFQKVPYEQVARDAIEKNPRTAEMPAEQRERMIAMQTSTVVKVIAYCAVPVATLVVLAAGGAIYLLAAMMMGGKLSYKQAVSVWAYSSFPPAVLGTVLALVMLFLKAPEDLDFNRSGAGLLVTNLGVLIGPEGSNVLRAALGWFDLFTFYGMWLAALGLRIVGKLTSGGAWTIVIALWLLGMILSVVRTALFGG